MLACLSGGGDFELLRKRQVRKLYWTNCLPGVDPNEVFAKGQSAR